MNLVDEYSFSCPYCGESISVLVDCSVAEQSYTEDCQVCCQPIVLDISVEGDGAISLNARREDE
jgi:transcription elongation factor Elf1